LKFVLLNNYRSAKYNTTYLAVQWRKLYDEFIAEFGFSESFLEIVRKQKQIAKLLVKKITTDDPTLETMIAICEMELADMQRIGNSVSFYQAKGMVEKEMGMKLDLHQCSVKEYYNYIKLIEQEHGRRSNQAR